MRTATFTAICLFTVVAVTCFTSPAVAAISDTEYFDFTGWDNALVTSPGGQIFSNIYEDVDVTVQVTGTLSVPTKYTGDSIKSGLLQPGLNNFKFTFSEPLPLVVQTMTVDSQERAGVFAINTETYFHEQGAVPNVSTYMSGIRIVGNGTGTGSDGAARGETLTGPSSLLTVTHEAFRNNKYEQIRVGTIVPEPSSISLFGIGLLGLVLRFRKHHE